MRPWSLSSRVWGAASDPRRRRATGSRQARGAETVKVLKALAGGTTAVGRQTASVTGISEGLAEWGLAQVIAGAILARLILIPIAALRDQLAP